jgi:hypothetical protein
VLVFFTASVFFGVCPSTTSSTYGHNPPNKPVPLLVKLADTTENRRTGRNLEGKID